MVRIQGSTLIARRPDEVFAFVADERNEPAYNPRMTRVELLTPGALGVGTRWRATVESGGRPMDMTMAVTEFAPPRRLASRTTMPGADVRGAITFDPDPVGTRLAWSWELRPRGVLRLAAPLIGVIGRRQEAAMWTRLKQLLESRPSDGSTA